MLLALLAGLVLVGTALAQTATDPNEGSRLTYDGLLGSYSFAWWGQPGRTYFLQHSGDLSAWEYLPLIESGTNGLLSWGFTSTASKFFLRLRYSDIPTSDPIHDDFDGDKISNNEEVTLGTDPLSAADTDANSLPDDWEKFHFGHIGVDPQATAPGGGMTNQQHFVLGSNPNNPPPPPTLTAGSATLDQSADTLLYPANETGMLLQNGNFSQPALGTSSWKTYASITGWTALSGTLIELQQINVNTTAGAGQYCELDAHWPTSDHSSAPDHGLQQTVNLPRGHYLLFCDYRARQTGADSFTVKLKPVGSTTETLLLTKNTATTTAWKRASVPFEVTGGNPNLPTLPLTLILDEDGTRNSYGPYIDNALLLPVEITFEPAGDNEPITDNKKKAFDADGNPKPDEWMPGKGKRVFPDAKDKNDQTERNKVKVKVKTAPGAVQNIYLKAFDVDDPAENDPNRIIDGNDGPQLKNGDDNKTIDNLGMPFPGVFAANESQSITLKVGSDGIATLPDGGEVEFIVGMQPGDNYRIAVAFKADNLNGLHVHSNVVAGYIKPNDDQPNGFNGVVSPMLTVWRKLYLEIDSMTAVPTSGDQKNYEEGTIETSSGSTLHLDISLTGPADRYENGHIDITDVGSFAVVSNTDNVVFDDDNVVVTGTPSSAAVGKTFKIYDDDDKYLSTLGLPAPLPKNGDHATIVNGIQTKFAAAYIQLEDASTLGWNPNQTVNFHLNAPGAGLFGANIWDGAKDLPSSTDKFWTWLVVYGYQPSDSISHPIDPNALDGDPDGENPLLGVTPAQRFGGARFGYSVVYVEVVRDSVLGGNIALNLQIPLVAKTYRDALRDLLFGTTAHEIGHGPSNGTDDEDHAEAGLMRQGGSAISGANSDFTPKTIKRFRERSQW